MQGTEDEIELALGDDESLPWLESDEDEVGDGIATGQIVGFVLALLFLLAAIVGGLWWWSNRATNDALVADGSTIAAPPGPYREKPADAGGKQFAGTGNVAPAVGEGKVTEGKIRPIAPSQPTAAPSPSISTRTTVDEPQAASGVGVQVGAYGSRATAEAGWVALQRQTEVLNGVSHRIIKGQADIGTVYRLQAVAGDLAAAQALCNALEADGLACQVKR